MRLCVLLVMVFLLFQLFVDNIRATPGERVAMDQATRLTVIFLNLDQKFLVRKKKSRQIFFYRQKNISFRWKIIFFTGLFFFSDINIIRQGTTIPDEKKNIFWQNKFFFPTPFSEEIGTIFWQKIY